MKSAVLSGLRSIAASGVSGMDRAINEDRIRPAVTGLSRAGKTVFITSLIHNLLALGHGRNTLPQISKRLTHNGTMRLRRVEVLPAGASVLPAFDYAAKLDQLASATPSWPPRTQDVAQISLALEIDRVLTIGRHLGSRRVRLDILDYPGEWLLDLPMLQQTYAAWSAQTLAMLRTPPRDQSCSAFLNFTDHLHADHRAEESLLHRGHVLYRAALQDCRTTHDLRYLQPGRFVCPGPESDAPFLWIFPLPAAPGPTKPGSNAALLEQRYDAYRLHVRNNFFDTHFASFDRQIMLVDVLGALYAGSASFDDTARVIRDLPQALRYGSNTVSGAIVGKMIGGAGQLLPSGLGRAAGSTAQKLTYRRIERIVFVRRLEPMANAAQPEWATLPRGPILLEPAPDAAARLESGWMPETVAVPPGAGRRGVLGGHRTLCVIARLGSALARVVRHGPLWTVGAAGRSGRDCRDRCAGDDRLRRIAGASGLPLHARGRAIAVDPRRRRNAARNDACRQQSLARPDRHRALRPGNRRKLAGRQFDADRTPCRPAHPDRRPPARRRTQDRAPGCRRRRNDRCDLPHPAWDGVVAGLRALLVIRQVAALFGMRPGLAVTLTRVRRAAAAAAATTGITLVSQGLADEVLSSIPGVKNVSSALGAGTVALRL